MKMVGSRAAKRLVLETVGWILLIGGVAALFLPGPGLLCVVAGLALLSHQYAWAERRLHPIKTRALEAAADGVATWPRIVMSVSGVVFLVGLGVFWGIKPDAPGWWPLDDKWWLPGGWGTGVSLIVSGALALALMVYSYKNFRKIKAGDSTP